MVVLEALPSGLPVVAVDDGVYNGIVKDKMNGALVDNDSEQFARACLDILNNPKDRERLSNFASKSMQDFSLSATVKSFEKLYKKLINEHNN